MKKKYVILISIIAVIFIAGVVGSIIVLNAPKKNTVRIKSGGKVLYVLDLSRESDREFEVKTERGSNTIEIKEGKIRVKSADCPDKTCVKTGVLRSETIPIVCLPHKLIIRFCDGEGQ